MGQDFDSDYALLMAFDGEHTDDRSLAIVFTSYAEKYLAAILQSRMRGLNQKLREKLFKPDGVLGPLQARIDVAKGLNVLDDDLFNDMVVLGSIRNQFAHNLDIDSFDNEAIDKRVKNLKFTPEAYPEGIPGWTAKPAAEWTNRDRFRYAATTICSTLHGGMGDLRYLRPHGPKN